MTYTLTFKQTGKYLHATVTGRNSKENVGRYLNEVVNECTARKCRYVLIEENLEGPRLRTMDVFEIASGQGRPLIGEIKAMAYVDMNAKGGLMEFAEDVAVNRGSPVRVFPTLEEAEAWLSNEAGGRAAAARTSSKPRD